MTKQQIIENVQQLPRDEQVDLAMKLWDMVGIGDSDLVISDSQKQELDRRIDAHDRNPGDAQPWQQVREQIKQELRGA